MVRAMTLDPSTIRAKVEQAKRDISAAEAGLERAISDLRERERADKEIIAPVMEAAFARLVAARHALAELDELVAADG